MGTCQSTGQNFSHSLEDTCGSSAAASRRKKQRRLQVLEKKNVSPSSDSEAENHQPIRELKPIANSSNTSTSRFDEPTKVDHSARSGNQLEKEHQINDIETNNKCDKEEQAAHENNGSKQTNLQKLKEGVDFIETEEDVKAVEAATLKIQSTFRGKKIRSKLGGGGGEEKKAAAEREEQQAQTSTTKKEDAKAVHELSKKVAEMQVNGKDEPRQSQSQQQPTCAASSVADLPEKAELAATKIQAGFKGYKTRKELEGKLPVAAGGAPAGGTATQQAGQHEQS